MDAALRTSDKPNAQLIAAELLCRNSAQLDPCQSLHWPSYIDGCWDYSFGRKTKLLLVDALTLTALAKKPVNEAALRSIAVRLYGIFVGDLDERFKGCVATLIKSLLPALRNLGNADFIQGNQEVMLEDLEEAAKSAKANDDDYLARILVTVRAGAHRFTPWQARAAGPARRRRGPAGRDRQRGHAVPGLRRGPVSAPAGDLGGAATAGLLARVREHAWMVAEAAVAVTAGVIASSIALVGFGLNSVIKLFAAAIVLWQLRGEGQERETRAVRLIGVTFLRPRRLLHRPEHPRPGQSRPTRAIGTRARRRRRRDAGHAGAGHRERPHRAGPTSGLVTVTGVSGARQHRPAILTA